MENTVTIPMEEILNTWGASVSTLVGNNYAMDSSNTVAKLPYARMFILGNPSFDVDMDGNENATTLSIQVEVFTQGQKALSNAYAIDAKSHSSLISSGFRRTYGPELIENSDTKIKRLISRYSKTLT